MRLLLAAVLFVWVLADVAANPVRTENVEVSLLAEHQSLVPGNNTWLLLRIDIRDGWHTYWRNPGDSGEPTRIEWSLPTGVSAGAIQWPAPRAIPFGGFVNFGYEGIAYHLVPLSVDAKIATPATVELVASATWLVCEEICIPESADLELSLPVRQASQLTIDASTADAFRAARSQLPAAQRRVDATLHGGTLQLSLNALPPVRDPYFFPYEWGLIEPSAEQSLVWVDDQRLLRVEQGPAPDQASVAGVLVDRAAPDAAWQIRGRVTDAGGGDGAMAATRLDLATALAFAFIGGLILNLMPCVFPVLSMKALHLIGEQVDGRTRRREGLAYAAGVLLFFLLLGAAILTLRGSGQAVGWGFQLQAAPVVGFLALLMFVIGLNLIGAFEIGARWMGAGSALAGRGGTAGAFFTGGLAAVVATPCTAPFMGAALGFALTQNAVVALVTMLSLGLGLAFPFLLIAFVPAIARRLPRPGAWMVTLKQLLAFPMFAAAVWLAWVLSIQAGADGVLRLLSAMLLAGFAVWLYGHARWGRIGGLGAAVVALGAVLMIVSLAAVPGRSQAASAAGVEEFSAARVARARDAGKTVFVNQTAAWCLTCLVNEKNVLARSAVQRALARDSVVYLKGDWTRRDPRITAFLAEHGRGGVPLYVVYHGRGDANVLPPLLTESIVLEALAATD